MTGPVSPEDFAKFFDSKKTGTYKCPVCSHEQFRVNGLLQPAPGGQSGPMGLISMPAIEKLPGPIAAQHTFLSFSCANCGRADFFHINQFNDWMAEQPKAPGEQDG